MSRKLSYLACFIIALMCLSCNQRETYYHFYELQNAKWSKSDTMSFDIDSSSILVNVPLDVKVELVNNTEYPYQNIWLYIQDDFDGENLQKQEKQYLLTDDQGKWLGSGFGSLYQLTLDYRSKIVFTEKKNYTVKIVQGMRDEPLIGIEKIGLKLILPEE